MEADLYTGQIKSIEVKEDEVQSDGVGITREEFDCYIKEGLAQIKDEFERPSLIKKGQEKTVHFP